MKNEKIFVDLHSHTKYSDGTDVPESSVRAAAMKGVRAFAITDHDTMVGYNEGKCEADKWGVTFVPGVEVTVKRYHILGLNVNPENLDFKKFLEYSRKLQAEQAYTRISMLQKHGVPIDEEKLRKAFPHPEQRIGRYNLLMAMLHDEECREYLKKNNPGMIPEELFKHYLGKPNGLVGKIDGQEDVSPLEAITAIHGAGGVAIIAHPFKNVKQMNELDKLREEGIDGLEIQPNYKERNNPFLEYAQNHGMKITYGSDFHGPGFARGLLGQEDNQLNLEELFGKKVYGYD